MSKPHTKTLTEERTGKPTKLKAGYVIVYYIQNKTLAISSGKGGAKVGSYAI